MSLNYDTVPERVWIDLCALAAKYATEEEKAQRDQSKQTDSNES